MSRRIDAQAEPALVDLLGSVDWIRLYVQRGGAGLFPSTAYLLLGEANISSIVITRGRRDTSSHPEPAAMVYRVASGIIPQPGDRVDADHVPEVSTAIGSVDEPSRKRFAGEVTSVRTLGSLSDVIGSHENRAAYQVTAVDQRARVNRWTEGDAPWPQEEVSTRVARVLNSTGTAGAIVLGGGPQVLARDVDNSSHGAILDELAEWTGAVLTLTRNVVWEWITLGSRTSATPDVELDASQVDGALSWSVDEGSKVTRCRVTYGDDGDADQPFVTVVNELAEVFGSLGDLRDRRPLTVTTQLVNEADARALATEIVARRSLPRWTVGPLRVDLRALMVRGTPRDVATVRQLIEAKPETSLIRMRGFPEVPANNPDAIPGPRSNGLFWLLGTTEEIGPHTWVMTLDVAPYEELANPLQWDDVDPDLTWDDVPSWPQWITARAWQPVQLGIDSWLDLPAALEWREVPDAVEWADPSPIFEE